MTDKNEGMVEIIKKELNILELLYGPKLGKLDSNNPDPKQQTDKLAVKEILKDFD